MAAIIIPEQENLNREFENLRLGRIVFFQRHHHVCQAVTAAVDVKAFCTVNFLRSNIPTDFRLS